MVQNVLSLALSLFVMFNAIPAAAARDCQAHEFEAPHREWGVGCVAQWLANLHESHGLAAHHADRFESMGVIGRELHKLNDTILAIPAEKGGHNVTNEADRQKILDGILREQRRDPSDSSDSGLYLPVMLLGCGAFVYIMFFQGTHLESKMKGWVKKMSKKVKHTEEGQAADPDDWLAGTAAAGNAGTRRRATGRGGKKK